MYFHWKILFFGFLIHLNSSNGQHGAGKAPPDPAARIAKGISSLGSKLLTSLETDSAPYENLLISPTNIFHAVALLHLAARGNTQKELSTLIGLPTNRNYSKTDIHSAMAAFYKSITTNDTQQVIVNIADALFLQNGFQIKKDFQEFVNKQYEAQIENIDFGAKQAAADRVNSWVSEKTRKRIPRVVDSFSPNAQAVIVNTLYFNAKWENRFTKDETHKDKFSTGENEVDVQMMHLIERLQYVNNAELQFESIDLPYARSDYALNIILPYSSQNVKNLIPKLKDISMTQIMEKSKYEGVEVKLPKTKFNVAKSLVKTFQQLGVQDLFTGANLSDLTDNRLRISEMLHSAEIEIDEDGTIATAATVTHFMGISLPLPIENPIPFHVNRPFIINIYNTKSSLNLFAGIVYKP